MRIIILDKNTEQTLKRTVKDIFCKHGFILKDFNVAYLPINYKPFFDRRLNTVFVALNSESHTKEQFVFQFSHECVHKYFDTPFTKENDVSWREEFAASIVSYAVCDELGARFADYLKMFIEFNFPSVRKAVPAFSKKIKANYSEHPAEVYSDEIKMPCLYYREHGRDSWKYFKKVYRI